MYQYRTSGLDNVFLLNGYSEIETSEGRAVSIHNLDGLHRAIANNLLSLRRRLKGNEFRFLRIEMDMSQKMLGFWLDKEDQTIANWEKGRVEVPKTADVIVRQLYSESLGQDSKLRAFFDSLNELDRNIQEGEMRFQEEGNEWSTAA